MIAAARRRAMVARVRIEGVTRRVDRRANALLVGAPRVGSWTRAADRRANRLLLRAWPLLRSVARVVRRLATLAWRPLRPVVRRLFGLLAWLERRLLRARDVAVRASVRASAVLTPERGTCLAIAAAAACLAASQFVDYRAVEIGQPAYAGLPAAEPPTVGAEATGEAHSYLLLPVAALAALLAGLVARNGRRRRLGRVVFALGALAMAVALLVDMPAGLDEGAQAARFSGATAVLEDGFYAEVASAAALMLTGLLLSGARKPRLARTQGGRRRLLTFFVRKQGGRPRTKPDEGLQRPAATMRGRA